MTMTHMQYIRPGDELILKGTPDITYVWNQPPYSRFVWNGTALEALGTGSGSGGGGGFGYLGAVASEAAMTELPAVVGSECLRTDLGVGGLQYELKALPATIEANWQPLQGVIPDGTLITISLVDGKLPRQLLVWVAAATEVTVSDGTTSYILIPSSYPHVIAIFDDPSAAAPTAITIQRTVGSASTGRYSLERA